VVTTKGIIGQMNALSKEIRLQEVDVQEEIRETEQAREMQRQEQEKATSIRTEEEQPTDRPEQGALLDATGDGAVEEAEDQECPEFVPQDEEDDSDDEMDIDEEEEQEIIVPCRSEHIKQGVDKLSRYAVATHPDGKSYSGVVVKVGGTPVFFGSEKQKCVSKSPTEAELVALSDNVGFVELFAEFVAFVTNSGQMKPLIYEDSTSVITMVTEGGGVT
jgi:hypothetical protein